MRGSNTGEKYEEGTRYTAQVTFKVHGKTFHYEPYTLHLAPCTLYLTPYTLQRVSFRP
jgi:hypothetical protein